MSLSLPCLVSLLFIWTGIPFNSFLFGFIFNYSKVFLFVKKMDTEIRKREPSRVRVGVLESFLSVCEKS